MRTVIEDKTGKFGIECDGGLEYESDFDTKEEAQAIADAHDNGAATYEEALQQINASDPKSLCPECGSEVEGSFNLCDACGKQLLGG